MPGDRRSDRRSDVDSPTGSEVLLGTLLQEFMILPVGAKSFKEALCIGCEVGAIWSDPFCCVFPTRWDRTRPGLPFVEELHQEEVRTGLVADVDFDTHVPPVSCLETKDACNVGDEAREVSQSENWVRSGVQIHQNQCSGVKL